MSVDVHAQQTLPTESSLHSKFPIAVGSLPSTYVLRFNITIEVTMDPQEPTCPYWGKRRSKSLRSEEAQTNAQPCKVFIKPPLPLESNFTGPQLQKYKPTVPGQFAKRIGVELDAACKQDDVDAIKDLTAHSPPTASWSTILEIAAAEGATQVATYCIQQGARVDDVVLDHVICSDRSEPAYRFFVEAGHISVDYSIAWRATMSVT